MTREDLVASFSLDRVKSSPARFDLKKLLWMNGEYIARQPADVFKAELSARLAAAGLPPAPLGCTLKIYHGELDGVHYVRSVKDSGEVNAEAEIIFEDI